MSSPSELAEIRQEIDRIDDALHDLLIQRAAAADRIRQAKESGTGILLRPGREATIIRRLLSRHHGQLPKLTLIRFWRELIGAMVCLQGPMAAAVYMPERGCGFLELARDHFGAYTPTTALRTAGQVVRAVSDGTATVGILPLPGQEKVEPWWTNLMGESPETPRIIARLPFAGPGTGRGDGIEAMAIARFTADPTGHDRSLLGLETPPDISRARLRSLLEAAGLVSLGLVSSLHREDCWMHLIELDGAVGREDPRLAQLRGERAQVLRAIVLGSYAIPLTPDDLA